MRVFYLLVIALTVRFGSAQQSVHQTTVTGTYAAIPLEEADRTVRTIPLEAATFRNLNAALATLPSLDVRQRAPGVQADLSIRGSSFGQTLVLLDGLRVNDAQTAHNNLDLPLPFEGFERIEVLEGSGSTLYGADAVGGAVNFMTRTPALTQMKLGLYGGSFGTNGQDGSLAYVRGSIAELLTFRRELSTGFMANRDYRNLAFGSLTSYQSRLGLTRMVLGSSDRPFGAAGFYGNYPSWERTRGWFASLNQALGEQTQLAFGYRRHSDLFDLYRARPLAYENRHFTDSWQAAVRRQDRVFSSAKVYYGAEGYRDRIDSNNLGQHTRDRGAAYLSLDARALRRFSFNAGMREEFFTGGRRRFSPSLAGGYWVNEHLRLHGSASSAFRLPTFTDLYYSDPANAGNPTLRPERAWSFESGVHVSWRKTSVDAVVFRRYDKDNIDYVRASANEIWRAANLTNLIFTGASVSGRIEVTRGQRLELAYTALQGTQQALGGLESKYLFQYPVQSGALTWWGYLPQQIAARLRVGVLDRYRYKAYPLVEFAAERQFARLKPYVQISNASNSGYEEIPGVRQPGRSYIAGVEVLLK